MFNQVERKTSDAIFLIVYAIFVELSYQNGMVNSVKSFFIIDEDIDYKKKENKKKTGTGSKDQIKIYWYLIVRGFGTLIAAILIFAPF